MTVRGALVAAGIAVFLVAVGEMLAPGAVPLPVGRFVPFVVGGVALLYAYVVLRLYGELSFDRAETPDPEVLPFTPAPGDDFERALDGFLDERHVHYSTRIVEGLEAAAVAVLVRYGGVSEAEAKRRIEAGTWTDDPYAAAFLGGDGVSVPVSVRLRDALAPGSAYRRRLRRTVDAVAAVAGVAPPDERDGGPARRWTGNPIRVIGTVSGSVAPRSRDRTGIAGDDRRDAGRATHHWFGVSVVGLVGIGLGLLAERPAVLLAGVVGLGYAAYARSSPLGAVRLSVERTFSDDDPEPGDEVEVTVTVTNEGSRPVPDLRVVDGVADALAVTDGSPRYGTPLRAGRSASYSYAVTARRGRHEFRPALAIARNLPDAVERELRVPADGASTLTCIPPLRPTRERVPLRGQATRYAGGVETDSGGEGIEFHATRRYRPGDPMNRVDWHRLARTGDLATLEFRRERAATVVLLVDAQPSAYRSPEPYTEHAVDRSVDAARRVFARLLDDGHQVGIGALGRPDCWLAPSSGNAHRHRGRTLLATDPALSSVPPDRTGVAPDPTGRLRRRLPAGAQLIVFSPLCEPSTAGTIRRLDADGHPASVVSPDPTADRTLGHRLGRVARRARITDLRNASIPVIDWPADGPLEEALARGRTR